MQTTTRLRLPPDQVFGMFRAAALQRDLPLVEEPDSLKISAKLGQIFVVREREGVRMTLDAADRAKLHALQEVVDSRLDEAGVAADRRWSFAEPGAYPPNLSFATVIASERISPSYFRIRVTAPLLERFSRDGLHFRLLFAPESHEGQWPTIAEDGRTEWPGGINAWHRPVYTTRAIDPEGDTLDFDVFVHDGGRVSQWCKSVEPGARIAMMGPGGEWHPRAGWIALFGDETALPAIARILQAMPASAAGAATIMVGHENDIQALARPRRFEVRWLLRGGAQTLLDALADLEVPETDRFVWFAGERAEAEAARKLMVANGLKKSEIRPAAYWTR